MMKQISKISAMLMLILGIVFSSTAQQRTGAPQQKRQMKFEKHEMLPDLTDAQKDQMKAVRIKTMKSVQPLRNQLMEKRARLNTLSSADKVDMKAINKQIDEMSTLKASMQKVRAASKQEVRSILTEDQRVIFDAHKGRSYSRNGEGNRPQQMRRKGNGPQGGFDKK